jgi:hypothetical protein
MPRSAFNQMRYTFSHKLDLNSLYVTDWRLALLSGVTPVLIDCCVNSCITYTRKYTNYTHCPYCRESRRSNQRPRHQFSYLPLVPCLQGFFQNPKTIHQLGYCTRFAQSVDGIQDVFNSELYKELCTKFVHVDGAPQSYKFFEGKHDIALSLCTDGYLIFGKQGR